ncbi:filamentous hemagglutinin N-terminal domain-containing protein [Salmonella enterica subsp. enterica serovar Carmel]|nr:filamentous hemagglutinin N-terminal domain-containing protein [Salmonella enterica]EGT2786626.1 filamentous hemagglutinin N-terminal domain-containing protein [Salmonella enterica subsp. enterica serovar Carmel]
MNRIYKLKFDRRRNALVVVSELTTGTGKTESTGHIVGLLSAPFRRLLGTLTPLALLTGLVTGALPMMALAGLELPTGGQVVAGSGSINSSGSQMTVQQNSQSMVTNWNTFDIGKNNTVQFIQPNSSAVALNRVTGGRESQILGTLKANGQVMLINPAGVIFGQGAKVNTSGLIASTKNISNADFMKGNYSLSGGAEGAQIVNQGSLTTSRGGYIVLAADRVQNSGSIHTPGGKTVLAAGETVKLQLDNSGLTSVSVNGSVVNALVENRGLLSATDGQVYLTAHGKEMLLNTVVNNSGTVDATGLSAAGGVIRLDGGDSGVVSQSGRLLADSSAGQGGTVILEGQNIHLAADSLTSATGKNGGGNVSVGGGWQGKDGQIKNAAKVVMDRTATVDVSAKETGNGGQAVLWSEVYTDFRGTILAKGGAQSGDGGRVETSSHRNLQAFGRVDASAPKGRGGEWLLDPTDVTIVGSGADNNVDTSIAEGFAPIADSAQILNTSINNQLNAGTNVTVKTSGVDTPEQWGNITVGAAIEKTAGGNAALVLEADGMLTVSQNISSTMGKLDISLLGAGGNTGMINVSSSTLASNGGDIILDRLNSSGTGTTAMTVKIDRSKLNASGTTNGSIRVNAWNPDVDLSVPQYKDTVSNNGTLLSVTNSNLTGKDINLSGNLSGSNGTGRPIFLRYTTLKAEQDISLIGNGSADSKAHSLVLRGLNTLNAGGNINISNTLGDANRSGAIAVYLIGPSNGKVNLTAGGNITLNGNGGAAQGVGVNNARLNASAVNITGTSRTGAIGFKLNNLTLAGGVQNGANVTLSSAGSAPTTINSIGNGIFDVTNINRLLATGIENLTQVSAGGLTLGNSSGDDWVENFLSSKGGGWIFDGATVKQPGNISLQGVGFVNGSVMAGKDLSIDNGAQVLHLNDTNVSAGGNITLTANGGINYVGGDSANHLKMVAGGNLSANASAGSVKIKNADLTSAVGNIDVYGNGNVGVELTNITACATAGNISVFGQGTRVHTNYDGRGGVTISGESSFNAMNTTIHGVNTGTANSQFPASGISFDNLGHVSNFSFNGGNVSVVGESDNGIGVIWRPRLGPGTFTLNVDADNFVIDGRTKATSVPTGTSTGGIGFSNFYDPATVIMNISGGSNVALNADASAASGGVPGFTAIPSEGRDHLQNKYVFNGDGNVTIIGKSNDGDAVNIRGFDNSALKGNMSIIGESASGTGVRFDKNLGVNLANAVVTGTSQTGTGVEMVASSGQATLTNVTLIGHTGSGNSGISLSGSNVSVNGTLNGSVAQEAGAGVSLNGVSNFTVSGATVNGTAVDGGGLVVTGIVNATDDTVLAGHSGGIGSGVVVQGSLNSPDSNAAISGAATDGVGTKITGITSGVYISGTAESGMGVELANNAQVLNTTVNGSSASGSGVAVTGSVTLDDVTAANFTGHSINGSGLSLQDGSTITVVQAGSTIPVTSAVQLNGSSVNGSGVSTSGNITLTNTILHGSTGDNGTGVTLSGNLTMGDAISGVNATAANGTALDLSNVTFNATNHGEPLILDPVVTGDNGTAIRVSGDTSLINVKLNGTSTNGSGVVIDGNLTTDQSVSGNTNNGTALTVAGTLVNSDGQPVTGMATGNGTGVSVTGGIGDNMVSGSSLSGTGAQLGNGAGVGTSGAVNGSSESGTGLVVAGSVNNQGALTGTSTSGTGADLLKVGSLIGAGLVNGSSTTGIGVSVTGRVDDNRLAGTSVIGIGAHLEDGANVGASGTVNGSSKSGFGVMVDGYVNNDGDISGHSYENTGMQTEGTLVGSGSAQGGSTRSSYGAVLVGTVDGNTFRGGADQGSGVYVADGASILSGKIIGEAIHGSGVVIAGNVNNQGSINGTSQLGSGAELRSNVNLSGGGDVSGQSSSGSGTSIAGDIGDNHVSGQSVDGPGAAVSSGASVSLEGTVSGISFNNSGTTIRGDVNNLGTISGSSQFGSGTELAGRMLGDGTVEGASNEDVGVDVTGVIGKNHVKGRSETDLGVLLNNGTSVAVGGSVTGSTSGASGVGVVGDVVSYGDIRGVAQNGRGVTILGKLSGGGSLTGNAESGIGVKLANNAQVLNTTVNGSSASGSGVAVIGSVTLDDVTAANFTGHSINGSGLSLQDGSTITVVQAGSTIPVTSAVQLNGSSVNGSGVSTSGNITLTNTILHGSTGDNGTGVTLSGNLTMGDAISGVNATAANGTALDLSNVTFNATNHGEPLILDPVVTGDNGTAIRVSGDTSLINVKLNGTSTNGSGVVIDGNLTTDQSVSGNTNNGTALTVAGTLVNSDGQPVTGMATGNGTGVSVTGGIGDNMVSGSSLSGTGAQLGNGAGVGTSGAVNGSSESGTGLVVAGSVNNQGALTGTSTSGTGADLLKVGSLTGSGSVIGTTRNGAQGLSVDGFVNGNTLSGTSASGTGLQVNNGATVQDATINGHTQSGIGVSWGSAVDNQHVSVSGDADSGNGVFLNDGAILNNVTVKGKTLSGTGVFIAGNLTGGSVVGRAYGSGDAINLRGGVLSDTVISGTSRDGNGVLVSGPVTLSGGSLTGSTSTGTGLNVLSQLTKTNGAVVKGLVENGGGGNTVNHLVTVPQSDVKDGMLNGQIAARIAQGQSAQNQLREGIPSVDIEENNLVTEVNVSLCVDTEKHSACRTMKVGTPGVQGVNVTPLVPVSATMTDTSDAR